MTIPTVVGPAQVLHRLALAVDCMDSAVEARVRTAVRIGWERPARVLPTGFQPRWPCWDLDPHGPGRAVLRFDRRTPTAPLRLRVVDPARRYVARRVDIAHWTSSQVLAAEAAPPEVPAAARSVRLWLLPGTGYVPPRGATVLRGRVAANGNPVRWARVTALGPGAQAVGRTHADERGEFFLIVEDTGTLSPPAPSTLTVSVKVVAPDPATRPKADPADPYADLVVEPVSRPDNPPQAQQLDNDVLRGRAVPAGYTVNTAVVDPVDLTVGATTFTGDIPFTA